MRVSRIINGVRMFLFVLIMQHGVCPAGGVEARTRTIRPNFVLILADDLGWGDLKAFHGESKIATPALDRLASEGVCFTDAHSTSSVCSPTRYSLLTGRYSWRSRLKRGVLGGLSPRLIEPGRMTLASMLKEEGYSTSCYGKWHLGMNWQVLPEKSVTELSVERPDQVWNVEYGEPFREGPTTVGFDRYFGIAASLDMVPYTFLENDRVAALPTEDQVFAMVPAQPEKGLARKGPTAPGFEPEQVLPELTKRVVGEIEARAADAKEGKPFFLYFPMPAPHTPTAPSEEWKGKSGINTYADFVMQTDASVGAILDALEKEELTKETIVCFTSDNGPSPYAQFDELKAKGHVPSGPWRGNKADLYEGGHRVPLIVRWPGEFPAGRRTDQLVSLSDFAATLADVLGIRLPENGGEDSFSFLSAARGPEGSSREDLISLSANGSFSYREKNWKLLLCPGSGGWSFPRPNQDDTSTMPLVQLYDLRTDPGETKNLAPTNSLLVQRMTGRLLEQVKNGRSNPGTPQNNTTPVDVWKEGRAAHLPLAKKK